MSSRTWKAIRLSAAGQALALQIKGSPNLRAKSNALLLTAGLVWFINGIHARPEDGASIKDLLCAILPNTPNIHHPQRLVHPFDIDDDQGMPFCPFGVIFFRAIEYNPVPRFFRGRSIKDTTYRYLLGKTLMEIRHKLCPVGFITRDMIPANHFPQRKGVTKLRAGPPPPVLVELENTGIVIQRAYEQGPDIPLSEDEDSDIDEEVPEFLTKLWYQFLSDILQKSGNAKNQPFKPSYCRMTMRQREAVTPEHFQSTNLALTWNEVQWKMASSAEWKKVFCILWPRKGHITNPSAQGWRQMQYYQNWKSFTARLKWEEVEKLRRKLLSLFKTLAWAPRSTNNRPWFMNMDTRYVRFPSGTVGPAPQILVNPTFDEPMFEAQVDGDGDGRDNGIELDAVRQRLVQEEEESESQDDG